MGLLSVGLHRARGAGGAGRGPDPHPHRRGALAAFLGAGGGGSRLACDPLPPGPRLRERGAPGCGEAAPGRGRAEGELRGAFGVPPGGQWLLLVARLREKARINRAAARLLWLIGTCFSKQRRHYRAYLCATSTY